MRYLIDWFLLLPQTSSGEAWGQRSTYLLCGRQEVACLTKNQGASLRQVNWSTRWHITDRTCKWGIETWLYKSQNSFFFVLKSATVSQVVGSKAFITPSGQSLHGHYFYPISTHWKLYFLLLCINGVTWELSVKPILKLYIIWALSVYFSGLEVRVVVPTSSIWVDWAPCIVLWMNQDSKLLGKITLKLINQTPINMSDNLFYLESFPNMWTRKRTGTECVG